MLRFVIRPWPRYAFALLATAVGVLLAVPVQRLSGGRVPFMTFFPVVTLVAAVAGVGPGLLATALSAAAVAVLWMEPVGLAAVARPADATTLVVYAFAGSVISVVGGSLRRAQLARRTSEERLRMALEAGRMGTWEWDVATGRVVWSPGLEELHGRPAGSFKGTFEDVLSDVHPDDRDGFVANVRRALDERADYRTEYRIVLPDGSVRWLEASGRLILDAAGVPAGMLGVCADATARHQAEVAVRQSEARFRALSDGAPIPISVSRAGRHLYVNAAYRRCFALPPDADLVGTPIFDQIAPEEHGRLRENVRRRFAGEPVDGSYEVVGLRADGSRLVIDVRVGQIDLPDGPASMAFLTDDTDRRRARDGLRLLADAGALLAGPSDFERSLAELARLVVPTLADWCAVDVLTPGGDLRRVAVHHPDPHKVELAHELHRRYPPDPATGGVWKVVRTRRPSCVPVLTDEMLARSARDADHLATFRALQLRSYVAVPLVARDRVLGVLTLVYAESGRTYDAADVALAEDLARRAAVAADNAALFDAEHAARTEAETSRAQAEALGAQAEASRARAERSAAEAERASRLKDEFLATLSHELRTPLNAILGWAQLLARPGGARDADDLANGLRTIERNARAQTRLIEDLLDMSRIVSGKLRLDVRPIALADVVAAAVASVAPAAAAKGVRLETDLDPAAGPVVGDPGRLQQAVWNLLTNAVKFTPPDGRVRVALARVPPGRLIDDVEMSVADTGQGVEASFLPHLFERFRQADGSTTRQHGGLGIGLSLVKQIVELHGGTVRAASAGPGSGATFALRLPTVGGDPTAASGLGEANGPGTAGRPVGANGAAANGLPTASPEGEPPAVAGVRVLVVDDEPDALALARRILEERGAVVATAGSAAEAVEALRAGPADVLLSDLGMPHEDGYQLIARVRALPAAAGGSTPAAALTAFAGADDRRRALAAGFAAYLVKPVEAAELLAVVADLAVGSGGPVGGAASRPPDGQTVARS